MSGQISCQEEQIHVTQNENKPFDGFKLRYYMLEHITKVNYN